MDASFFCSNKFEWFNDTCLVLKMNATRISFIDCSQWGNNERVNIRIESFYLSTFVQTTVVYSLKIFFFCTNVSSFFKAICKRRDYLLSFKVFFFKIFKRKKTNLKSSNACINRGTRSKINISSVFSVSFGPTYLRIARLFLCLTVNWITRPKVYRKNGVLSIQFVPCSTLVYFRCVRLKLCCFSEVERKWKHFKADQEMLNVQKKSKWYKEK